MSRYYRGTADTVTHGHIITLRKTKKGIKVITFLPHLLEPMWLTAAREQQQQGSFHLVSMGSRPKTKATRKNIDPRTRHTDYTNMRNEK